VQRTMARARQPLNVFNHVAATRSARDLSAALAQIHAPTLVIHGAHDPLLPPAHGALLARAIPGASLLEVPDMGHMFDQRHLALVTPRVIAHFQTAMRAAIAAAHTAQPIQPTESS
jgi:pimeloyl-ACP methyl ester carboxylesterase